jgi:hypothetical protein
MTVYIQKREVEPGVQMFKFEIRSGSESHKGAAAETTEATPEKKDFALSEPSRKTKEASH